jgi:hypothetical protein
VVRDATELTVRTRDHPEAAGRQPQAGESAWVFELPLEDGRVLRVETGREGHDALRRMIFAEAIDDATEELP